MRRISLLVVGVSMLSSVLETQAAAADGLLEINNTCAAHTGCFSGDSPGYPITINGSAGRSYRLTSDLVVPDADTDGILIVRSAISIDLNGFAIERSGCQNETFDCTPPSGTGSGINGATLPTIVDVSLRDGSIRGMGNHGVRLLNQSDVRNLRIRWNRLDGINVGGQASVVGNTVFRNGRNGILADFQSNVVGNTVRESGADGIRVSQALVSSNTSGGNLDDGIDASDSSRVVDNLVVNNASDGIEAGVDSWVQGNVANFNGAAGLNLSSEVPFRENTISAGSNSTVVGGVNAGLNYCTRNLVQTSCP